MDDTHPDSFQSVQSGHHSQAASPTALGVMGPTILNKILGTPHFLGTEREKDTVQFKQWYRPFQMLRKISMSSW